MKYEEKNNHNINSYKYMYYCYMANAYNQKSNVFKKIYKGTFRKKC